MVMSPCRTALIRVSGTQFLLAIMGVARRQRVVSRQLQSASGPVQLAKMLANLRQVGFDALKLQPPLFAE